MNIFAGRVFILLAFPAFTFAGSFTPLGFLNTAASSYATGISADGKTVVGESGDSFRWSNGVMTNLSTFLPASSASYAGAASADGTVVAGAASIGSCNSCLVEAARWADGAVSQLGLLYTAPEHSASSFATAISANGGVVVGYSSCAPLKYYPCVPSSPTPSGLHYIEAFRWADGVMTGLGVLPGTSHSKAFGVSADGAVVVGSSGGTDPDQAFRWVDGLMSGLGHLPGGADSSALAVSADGSVIVGQSTNTIGAVEAFRWTDGVMTGLGHLPGGNDSSALAVSGDGSVVVGASGTVNSTGIIVGEAFVSTASNNMARLLDVLIANGAAVPTGWTLAAATGISKDGKWVIGNGVNPNGNDEAFIANIAPGDTVTASGGGASGGGGALDGISLIILGGLVGLAKRRLLAA